MTAIWIFVVFLLAWNLWNEWNDGRFSTRLRELEQRASDDGKDITSLAKAVRELERYHEATHVYDIPAKKPLTPKNRKRRTPPRR